MRDDGRIDSASDYNSYHDNMPPLEDCDEDFDNPVKGETFLFAEL